MVNFNLIKRVFKTSKVFYLSILIVSISMMAICFWSADKLVGANPTPEGFFNTYNKIYFGTFGLIFTSSLAALLPIINLTKEIDNCSLSIYLVSDKSRTNILINKYASIFLMLFIYSLFQILVLIIGFSSINIARSFDNILKSINLVSTYFLGMACLMSINFMFASLLNEKNKVFLYISLISVISTLMRITYSISGSNSLDAIQYISIYAFNNDKLISNNNVLSIIPYIIWLLIIPPIILISINGFKKRNLYL